MATPMIIDADDITEVRRLDAALPDVPLDQQPADRDFTPAELHAIYVATLQLAEQLGTLMLRPNPPPAVGTLVGLTRTAANLCRRRLLRAGYRDPREHLPV